jgi:hypothetical protein
MCFNSHWGFDEFLIEQLGSNFLDFEQMSSNQPSFSKVFGKFILIFENLNSGLKKIVCKML